MIKENDNYRYEASKRIIFDENEINLFKNKLNSLLSDIQFEFRDKHIKIFCESRYKFEHRDNERFSKLDKELESVFPKAYKILKAYKEEHEQNA